jgi:hypothetical protein
MASKRVLKKNLYYMVADVVDECYNVSLYNPAKTAAAEQVIDEAVQFHNEVLTSIHQGKTKKDFPAIVTKIEDAAVDFIHKINGLQ